MKKSLTSTAYQWYLPVSNRPSVHVATTLNTHPSRNAICVTVLFPSYELGNAVEEEGRREEWQTGTQAQRWE